MGRSSIIFISTLLSFDYGLRVSAYISLASLAIRALLCKLDSDWYQSHAERIRLLTDIIVPLIFLAITLPLALKTRVGHLKYYARVLFLMSCVILVLVFFAMIFHTDR